MRFVTLTIFIGLATGFACVNGATSEEELQFLESVDKIIEKAWEQGSRAKYAEAKQLLLEWCAGSCSSSATLWRLANCCYYLSEVDKNISRIEKSSLIKEGCEYAEKAVMQNDRDPEAHKWMAILSGHKGNLEGGSAKVRGGVLFQNHINRAIELNPNDSSLYFLKGYFQLEIGSLGWLQRKAASTIFSDFPKATIKDAIASFRRAGELFKQPWKINSAYLAKSYYIDNNRDESRKWLKIAEKADIKNYEDKQAEVIIAKLQKSF